MYNSLKENIGRNNGEEPNGIKAYTEGAKPLHTYEDGE